MYHRRLRGFTLVELLIVMAILGILAGLLAWGVSAARTSILKRAQRFEIEMIAQAVEQYRTKYGDYPPDGSSWPIVEAHLRKAFPNILITELNLLNPANAAANTIANNNVPICNDSYTGLHPFGGRVMDPAEALVFFLGGFSTDPQRPLTGPGGPLKSLAPNGISFPYTYNTQRENSFFEFKTNRLVLSPDGTVSGDETFYSEGVVNDLLPVFIGAGPSILQGGVPIVYFDSRSYQLYNSALDIYFANFYTPGPTSSLNCARPFLSDEKNNAYTGASPPPEFDPKPQLYANNKSFQLLNAGYDKIYGCQPPSTTSVGMVLFATPSGRPCLRNPPNVNPVLNLFFAKKVAVPRFKYYLPDMDNALPSFGNIGPVDDNTSNFIDGPTFAESP